MRVQPEEFKIPLGVCGNCGYKQTVPATGRFWINGEKDKWFCTGCKYTTNVLSNAIACEWCTSKNVKWIQGKTYECRTCKEKEIGQALFKKEGAF